MKFLILLYKEIVQFFRNKGLLLFALYAFSLDIYLAATGIDLTLKNASFFVQDRDFSYLSKELVSRFPPNYFNFKGYVLNDSDIEKLLLEDKAVGIIRIPKDFEKKLKRGDKTFVGVIVNGAELSSSFLFSAYASSIIYRFLTGGFFSPPLEAEERIFFNQDASSKEFMAFSELLTVITLFLLLLPAAAVVMEKERGNIEMVVVSPLKVRLFMMAKALSMGGLVVLFTTLALVGTIEWVLEIPVKGGVIDFLILTLIYAFAATGLSMFIAAVSENMLQVSQLTILVLIPILYLSGSWTPIETMPKVLQWLSHFSPLKYYIDGALAIAIKEVSIGKLTNHMIILTFQGLLLFAAGNYFLTKRI